MKENNQKLYGNKNKIPSVNCLRFESLRNKFTYFSTWKLILFLLYISINS